LVGALVGAVACDSGEDPGVGGGVPSADLSDNGNPDLTIDPGAADLSGVADLGGPSPDLSNPSPMPCKRGIASNQAPSSAFARNGATPGIVWWYNWGLHGTGAAASIEFVPMVWGQGSINSNLPAGANYVLGFNEPNFKVQSNLSPQQAANDWGAIETHANGIPIVSPAVNFCGSSSDTSGCTVPSITDPYSYLKAFFAACQGCRVDYIAVHWYNCDLASLQAYIEGNINNGGTLEGFVQFGKPIWLTEFACDNSHPVAEQKAYMQAAIPYLENNPHIYRYSWFSSTAIPNAMLADTSGTLTELGATYIALPQACP
jgi:hypothetical protein